MKRLMAERQGQSSNGKPNAQPSIEDLWNKPQSGHPGNNYHIKNTINTLTENILLH